MTARSNTRKQLMFALVGFLYAAAYGFWTMLATGGGHVNFIWFWLFLSVEFFGLYFPVMSALMADLTKRGSQVVYASLICLNVVASVIFITEWVMERNAEGLSDFERTIRSNGLGLVVFCAVMHFLPTLFFSFFLLRAVTGGAPVAAEDDDLIELRIS